jgi:hypothetical protein
MSRPSITVGVFSLFLALFVASPAFCQVPNDHCAGAIPVGPGHTLDSNAGATLGPDPVGSCVGAGADVWYVFVAPCNGPWAASTCAAGTAIDTVLTIWDGSAGCGSLVPILCNDDFCGLPFSPTNSYVTFQSVAGATYYLSVAGFGGAMGGIELVLEANGTELHFFSNGPGTIGYEVLGGPPGGTVYTALTLNGALYPYGWFYGISIDLGDVISQLTLGFPFVVGATAVCGDVTIGPVGGLPSGLTLYGVAIGIPAGWTFPSPAFISVANSAAVP